MKKPFTDEQLDILLAVVRKHQKRFKNQTELALALGVTQPSISSLLLGKWKPGLTTARAIAELDGMALEELIGPVGNSGLEEGRPGGPSNLETCIHFFGGLKTWSPATLAAARAGAWQEDTDAPSWEKRLDDLDAAIRRVVAGRTRK